MKTKTKLILCSLGITFLICIALSSYITYNIISKKYRIIEAESIELANMRVLEAENKNELDKEFYNSIINNLNEKLKDSFDNMNYQPVNNDDIPQSDVLIDFVPDYYEFPELIHEAETRVAITNYKWRDIENKYNLNLEIKYTYKDYSFKVTPSRLDFDPFKPKLFCLSAIANTDSYGLLLQYDFLKYFRLSSGAYLSTELNPVIGIGIGIRF